jgi:leader peptidase (prepilin peptidase)/N-methyltransferase
VRYSFCVIPISSFAFFLPPRDARPLTPVLAAFIFVVGACVGSFLNVVIYRLPAGKSLVRPGSHCPKCRHAIRWYDNVPIVSWLVLGGRCRDCRAPIASRYAVVELITGFMFLVLALAGPLSGQSDSLDRLSDFRPWISLSLHAATGSALIAVALIAYDGPRIPPRLLYVVLVLAAATAMWHYRAL